MPKLDISKVPVRKGSGYPAPFFEKSRERIKQALGDAGGLTDFGVNYTRLPPGEWSSQRHWHRHEDEFVYVISGELTLITDAGEEAVRAGDCVAFPKAVANGHHFINRGKETAVYLEVGTRSPVDFCTYPDVDMQFDAQKGWYDRKDGTPYPRRE
ncbi:MAG: cupin domain-containing protein [Alphaproteobacteria bacterium]